MLMLFCFLSIIGIVVGAGFLSGREVLSFFARFGLWSFCGIALSFFLFWFLFYFLLNFKRKQQKNSKISLTLSLIITLIFSSAMFAGINNLISYDIKIISFCLFSIVIFLCYIVFKNGLGMLTRLNLLLIPCVLFVLIIAIVLLTKKDFYFEKNAFECGWIIYSFFYCALNVSNGSYVLMRLGDGLSQKQKARVSFLSALVLALLLFAVNIILLQNPKSFSSSMPLLSLCEGPFNWIMNFIILLGSLSSLLSLVFTSSSLIRGLCKNEFFTFSMSVIVPSAASLFGFSMIITYLYPIASALGIILLGQLLIEKHKEN